MNRSPYRGGIFPVNPKYRELSGLKCYASLADIAEPVDIAVIAVPAAAAVDVVKSCGEAAIPYAVVLGGGFRETGEAGAKLQEAMLAHARAHAVRIIGPNCLGFANIHERVFAAFGSITRAPRLRPGPVSMVLQSGGFGYSIALNAHAAGAGFRIVVASGNEADITAPELIDALIEDADYVQGFRSQRLPRGRNVAVMGGSGGSAVVFADAADQYRLTLPRPGAHTAAVLREVLPSVASLDNPIDYAAGFINDANAPRFLKAVEAVLADPGIDHLCAMFATVLGRPAQAGAEALANAVQRFGKPVYVFSSVPRDTAAEAFDALERARIPVMPSPTRVARLAGLLADYAELRQRGPRGQWQENPSAASPPEPFPLKAGDAPYAAGALDEADSKRIVAAYGVEVTRDEVILDVNAAAMAAIGLRFPLAVKVLCADIAHKTDVGGVRLGVKTREELSAAAQEVIANARIAAPAASIRGVLVSEMIFDAVEVIVGVVNDAVFGPVVALGMGGVLAEALRDVTFRVAPFDTAVAREMLAELRGRRVFEGLRGRAPCDTDALADALVKVSQLAWQQRERIAGIDINPLMVRAKGLGVVAADALVVLR